MLELKNKLETIEVVGRSMMVRVITMPRRGRGMLLMLLVILIIIRLEGIKLGLRMLIMPEIAVLSGMRRLLVLMLVFEEK
jgi:hypothetical protein